MRERTGHAAGGVMLGEAVGGEHVREFNVGRTGVVIAGARFAIGLRIGLPVGVKRIFHRGFERLVVRRKWTVGQTDRDPDPAEAVGVEDERLVAFQRGVAFGIGRRLVVRSFGGDEIGDVVAGPFFGGGIPPH